MNRTHILLLIALVLGFVNAHASDELIGRSVIVKRTFIIKAEECKFDSVDPHQSSSTQYTCSSKPIQKHPYETLVNPNSAPVVTYEGSGYKLTYAVSKTGYTLFIQSTGNPMTESDAWHLLKKAIPEQKLEGKAVSVYVQTIEPPLNLSPYASDKK